MSSGPPNHEDEAPQRLVSVVRNARGQVVSGALNPGGTHRGVAEARKLALSHVPAAIEKCVELLDSEDPFVILGAIKMLLERGLGRPADPSALPVEAQLAAAGDTSARGLLTRSLAILERGLAATEAQIESGIPLSEAQRSTLKDDVTALASLLKAEAETAKGGEASGLTDAQLKEKLLGALSTEELSAELAKRSAA